jgi:putative peptidoglycan lipid II flippase
VTGDGPRPSLLRSNVVVASGTALSRITGLARVAVFAYVIGQNALADTYRIGNETPNIVYELLLGGVLSATLVPLFTSFDEDDDEESKNVVITVTLAALAVITAVACLAAPLIFGIYTLTPSEGVDPDQLRDVGTLLTRVFLLQIFFYGATALANALLNSRRRFFAAAWSPILPNLLIIASLLSLPDPSAESWTLTDVLDNDRVRWTLGLGATLGIASMALVLVLAVRASGIRYRPSFRLRHPAVGRLLRLSGWTLGYVVANQIVIVIVRNLAEPGSGDAAAYFDAYTFFVLPHGLLAMSIATTFIPEMARSVARRERDAFNHQAALGVRLIALLTLPAGVALFVLRRAIVGLFLERGEYLPVDALNTSRALGGFALGLVGFSIYLFTLRGFYAHQDTRTPFVINVVECVLNIVLALLLVDRFGVLGLGLAFAIANVVAALWSLQVLSYKVAGFPLRDVLVSLGRTVVAAALAGEVMWLAAERVGANTGAEAAARITVAGVAGVAVYVAVLAVLRAPELHAVRTRLPVRPSTTTQ